MGQLSTLLEIVKDEKLTLPDLEKYRDQLTHLYSAILIERSELRKREAFFFMDESRRELSDVQKKREWRITPEGQRLLEIDAYRAAVPKELDSLKSRIYSQL